MDTMDSKIAITPAITEPVRNDWHLQQLFKIGFAIFSCAQANIHLDTVESEKFKNQSIELRN